MSLRIRVVGTCNCVDPSQVLWRDGRKPRRSGPPRNETKSHKCLPEKKGHKIPIWPRSLRNHGWMSQLTCTCKKKIKEKRKEKKKVVGNVQLWSKVSSHTLFFNNSNLCVYFWTQPQTTWFNIPLGFSIQREKKQKMARFATFQTARLSIYSENGRFVLVLHFKKLKC